ncbi:PilN family type IVB pilus formation outer membrane protein [Paraburkholderia sp. Ac-20336]|uniref:PilN family type IVB pilus formation outer membrane protein n=1 Tax=Paraburkholderia sp. Ac-20336 TaxID=2703886 RepID=UPI00198050B8|nr:PilN family type IVB pilus formation outer membrane protein [Paraburkholderia sp. Ac-20336]MBN3806986.1 PilN family type IVB pilus formation outer membrane protein [Paraburkholderia sp. Ac-20336]
MSRLYFHVAAAVACVALASGCTGLMGQLDRSTRSDLGQADKLLGQTASGNNRAVAGDDVIVKDQLWLSGKTMKIAAQSTLPKLFDEPASFDGTVDSLRAFADRVSRLARVPAKVAHGADDAAARASSVGAAAGSTLPPGVPPLPPGMLQGSSPAPAGAQQAMLAALPEPIHIVYPTGTLHGLLDAASARFGVSWKYEDGAIVFFYTATRVYQVVSIPGDSKLDTNVVSGASNTGGVNGGVAGGSAGGGGVAGGGVGGAASTSSPEVSSDNTANIKMNTQLSVYTSLQTAIKSMLSPAGSVVTSPATGSIAVTDTPEVLDRVGEFMEQQNRVLARQVLLNVTVLSVTLSANDSYGIDWNAVYQTLGTKFNMVSGFSSLVQTSSLSATVISPSSRASATNAMISALSSQGTVHRRTSASITTLNDQPVPVQVAEQKGYLASVSSIATLNVGTQVSLTPGTITTGFNLTVLPHVLDDGTVMMQFYSNISSLVTLDSFTSGGQTIQLPTVDTRNFLQRIAVKSGQTLVLSGYEDLNDQNNRQGIGTPSNYALGGGFNADHSRQVIVILLSPVTTNGA